MDPVSVAEDAGGTTVTVTGTLDGAPRTSDTAVTVAVGSGSDAAVEGTDYSPVADVTLTIPADAMSGTATFMLTPVDDAVDEPDETVAVTGTVAGLDVTGTGVTIGDDDAAPTVTLSLSDASIDEDGGATTVTASLSHASSNPTTITVSVTPQSPATALDYTLSANRALTIAAGATASTGTVSLTAVDNDVDAADKTLAVKGAASNTLGAGGPEDVALTIADDDARGVTVSAGSLDISEGGDGSYTVVLDSQPTGTVTVTPSRTSGDADVTASGALTFTAADWDTAQTVTVSAAEDDDALDDTAVIGHSVSGADYGTVSAAPVDVTVEDDETASSGVGDVRLVQRGSDDTNQGIVQIYYDGQWGGVCHDHWDMKDAKVACRQLGFSGADAALSRIQGPAGMPLWLDNVNCTGQESTLLECQSTRWGDYIPNQCARSEFAGATCTSRSESVLLDTQQVTVWEQSSATYQVWLEKEPTADVTVAITGQASTDVTVSPASLTFTTTNWKDRQTVTVSAADDLDMTDDTVTLSHDPSGGGYASANTKTVAVTVKDNDDKGVSIDPTTLNINEGASPGGTYSVVLTGSPSASVTVTVDVPSGTDISVSPASLTFTTSNWNTAKTVSVTAAGDDDRQPDSVTLTHSASGGDYGDISIASVAVQVRDVDTVLPVRFDVGGIITLREGDSATYSVWLAKDPIDAATVTVDAPPELSVSPNTLNFDLSNWSQPQTVTIEALQDSNTSDERLLIRHTLTEGGNTRSLDSVQVRVTDDDDGEALVGPRPANALWWAALTARRETGGAVGFLDYEYSNGTDAPDTGKLSDSTFILRGVTREIEGLFVQGGTLQGLGRLRRRVSASEQSGAARRDRGADPRQRLEAVLRDHLRRRPDADHARPHLLVVFGRARCEPIGPADGRGMAGGSERH